MIELLSVSHFAHIPGAYGDERCQRKRDNKKEGKTDERETREELGSFLKYVDRRCCVHDRDRARNATHQCRLAG